MSPARAYKLVEDLEGAQRVAATVAGNVVVAAGAGSGKTTVLAARYVRLLETGRMPSGERVHARNILVLTFTRKAAAEMYSRIHGALSVSAARARDPGLAMHLAACLADFSQAQISTFDSFAARVARSGSSRYGLAPDFTVDEERAWRSASDLALSFILERREEEAMRDLVASAGLEDARDDVLASLALERMSLSSPPDFSAFHERQAARLEELAAAARQGIFAIRAAALVYSGIRTTPGSKAWLEALEALPEDTGPEDTGPEDGFLSSLDRLARLRKPPSNSRDAASIFLSDCVPDLRKAAEAYADIAATRAAHPGRLSLYRLLDDFRARWDDARRAEKTLAFRDVARLALDVLETEPAVLGYYQGPVPLPDDRRVPGRRRTAETRALPPRRPGGLAARRGQALLRRGRKAVHLPVPRRRRLGLQAARAGSPRRGGSRPGFRGFYLESRRRSRRGRAGALEQLPQRARRHRDDKRDLPYRYGPARRGSGARGLRSPLLAPGAEGSNARRRPEVRVPGTSAPIRRGSRRGIARRGRRTSRSGGGRGLGSGAHRARRGRRRGPPRGRQGHGPRQEGPL